MERLQEYRTHNSQFCKRMFDFLSIMFVAQVSCSENLTSALPSDSNSLMISLSCFLEKRLALQSHLNHDRWPPHTLTLKLILDDTQVSCSTLEKWTKIFIASYARYLESLSSYFLFLMTFRLTSLPQVIYTALK